MPAEHVETLIIGGGQAGLTMSHMLSKRGHAHLVLERSRVAERWRSERWDGLRLQGPNWTIGLPDFPFVQDDPDAYATRDQIVDYLAGYAAFIGAPVRCGIDVTALRPGDGGSGFVAETNTGPIHAGNVVVATGAYQGPVVPDIIPAHTGLFQVHSAYYRNPGQLPAGAVLVVGAGSSGAQIAEELLRSGRRVYLSVSRHRRWPRTYRGRNLHWWIHALGLDETTPEQRGPDRAPLVMSGAYGGRTVDFRRFAHEGMVLLGRTEAMRDGMLPFAPDLPASLAHGDAAYAAFLDKADAHVSLAELDLPEDPDARAVVPDPPAFAEPAIRELDVRAAGISAVVWATGFAADFSWIKGTAFDARGVPVHRRGVTAVPGLYLLGLPFLSKFASSFISGVGEDAARLADLVVRAAKPDRQPQTSSQA